MKLDVRRDAVLPDAWDAFVATEPHGSVFHLERWGACIAAVYRLRPTRLTVHRDGALLGGVTLFETRGPLGERHLTTLPYAAHHHALLAESEEVAGVLAEAARREAARRRGRFVELREAASPPRIVAPAPVFGNYLLPLDGGAAGAWQRVEGPVRTKIRRARAAGLVAEWQKEEGIAAFYPVYLATMRRLGSPPHARQLFATVFRHFRGESSILTVRQGEETLAAAFVLRWRDWMGIPWAASRADAFALRPNNLLFWSIIERACAEGLDELDMGRSPLGSGPAHFKRGWGARERPLCYLRLRPDGKVLPPLNPASPLLRGASSLWRRLPAWLAARWGPYLARRLP